jgi:3-hydroxyisobutyrate dehydrogenase
MMQRAFARAFSHKVGFIGMGNMGLPMCQNLKKNGFEVPGFDISESVKAKAEEAGIKSVDSVKEAVAGADFVVTCLPKTEHVEKVLHMEDGLFASAKKGAYICDVSTISPVASANFYNQAKEQGLTFLDSPMSGGTGGAEAGTLTFMIGGEKEEVEHAKTLLNGMGKNIFHTGKPGTGEVAKLVNNLILGINMCAASEGLALGQKLGIDSKVLTDICSVSTSRSFVMDTYNPVPGNRPNSPANRDYEGGFAVALIEKDMGLAIDAAKAVDGDLKMTEYSIEYYRDLMKKGKGGKDYSYTYPYILKNRDV